MKLIYKKPTGSPAATDKVADYNFREHYPDMNMNSLWASIMPYIRQATDEQIIPFVGQALYDDIALKVDTGATLSAQQERLVELMRDAVAYHAVARMLPMKKTTVSSMGAVENVAKEGTTGSSLWGFRTTLWQVVQSADRATDRLLAYMESQVKAGVAYFDLWKNDDAYTAGSGDLFRTTADFQQYWNINDSRRTFLQLIPVIRQAARRHIVPALSSDLYSELVDQVAGNNLSTENIALLPYVRAALAYWTIYYASDTLTAIPENGGFRVISNAEAIDSRVLPQEVLMSAIDRIKFSAEANARTNTADLVAFVATNADDYPLWKASSANPDNDARWYIPPAGDEYGAVML